MLKSIGQLQVLLLDGGLAAWEEAGYETESGVNTNPPAHYPVPPSFRGVVGSDDLSDRLVIDVRAPERYTGDFEPVDPRAGHIPGAINIPASSNLESGRFASRQDLQDLYRNMVDPVFSCGSGVNACHSALALVHSGAPMPDIYIGSFSEWSSSSRPISTGANP